MHKNLIFALILLSFLGGCSRHYHPLDPAKKEKLVSELISSNPQCSAYKQKLKSPKIEDDDVDTIYHEAMKAHCINKDV